MNDICGALGYVCRQNRRTSQMRTGMKGKQKNKEKKAKLLTSIN
jgi:hypothetical protein